MNIKKSIPNTITCCSLLSGCVAVLLALRGDLQWAAYWVMAAAIFDFCDGLAARTLQAFSPIGKDLDSLSDMVSFGVAPGMIVFRLLEEACQTEPTMGFVPYLAFVIPVFSALRLAKFNIDERQTTSFIGMPVPAHALFWASLAVGAHATLTGGGVHPLALLAMVCMSSWLLVSEIPMFSLKFKDLSWAHNKLRFIFLLLCVVFLALWQVQGLAVCIVWYVLLSVLTARKTA